MARGRSSTSPPTGVPAGSSDAIRRLTAILHRRVASCLSCQFPCGFPGRPARAKSLQGAQRHRRDRLQRQRGASGDQPLDKIKCKIRPKVPHDPCVLHRGHRQAAVGRKRKWKSPVRRRRGPENPCTRYSAHAKLLWFTRSRWTPKMREVQSMAPVRLKPCMTILLKCRLPFACRLPSKAAWPAPHRGPAVHFKQPD